MDPYEPLWTPWTIYGPTMDPPLTAYVLPTRVYIYRPFLSLSSEGPDPYGPLNGPLMAQGSHGGESHIGGYMPCVVCSFF